MTYEGALNYLSELGEARIQPGLTRITRALSLLGNPQTDYATVLVGGTNGKGSTVSFLSSMLIASGYRVGVFTSPHLVRFEERIAVDGDCLPAEELAALLEEVRRAGVELSYFELASAMAMVWFRRRAVDVAVLEVGLGGRWDATNAADPLLSVITTIDLDHQAWLGSTLSLVAGEKAQIMRPGRPVIVGRIRDEALAVLAGEAVEKGALLLRDGLDFTLEPEAEGYVYRGRGWRVGNLRLGLPGRFQVGNASCAMAAAEALSDQGFTVPPEAARRGLAAARWPGRFETLPGRPEIILDCAHNPAAMEALAQAVREKGGAAAWVFSALADKDLAGMARIVAAFNGPVFLVGLASPRALDVERLAQGFSGLGAPLHAAASVREAIDQARKAAGPAGRVVVTGSNYLVGRAMQVLQERGLEEGALCAGT